MAVLRILWLWLVVGTTTITASYAQQLDSTFWADVHRFTDIHSVVAQADGRYVVLGEQIYADGVSTGNLTCFLADGTIDYGFQQRLGILNIGPQYTAYPPLLTRYPDGRLLVVSGDGVLTITRPQGNWTGYMFRLLPNGRLDSSFQAPAGIPLVASRAMAIQPDGKILLAGRPRPNGFMLMRLNANGSRDLTFNATLGSGRNADELHALALQPDGKILVGGAMLSPVNGLARLLPTGQYDPSFQAGATNTADIQQLLVLPSGAVLATGRASTTLQGRASGLHQLLPSGQLDLSFQSPAGYDFVSNKDGRRVQVLPSGKLLVCPYQHATVNVARLLPNGQPDGSFAPDPAWPLRVNTTALDTAGRLLVGGEYQHSAGPLGTLLRMAPAGGLDGGFRPQLNAPGRITKMLALAGGEIVLVGEFDVVGSYRAGRVARLLPGGAVDTAFQRNLPPIVGTAFLAGVQPSGRLLIGGFVQAAVAGLVRTGIIGLKADGSLDAAFAVPNATISYYPDAMVVQPDGRVLMGGQLASYLTNGSRNLVRLQTNGGHDSSFGAPAEFSLTSTMWQIRRIALQPDGRVLVAGPLLRRLQSNGAMDNSFQPTVINNFPNFLPRELTVQPDGRIILCGQMPGLTSQTANMIRLHPDGRRDTSLHDGVSRQVFATSTVLVQANQQLLIGGGFIATPTNSVVGLLPLDERGYPRSNGNTLPGFGSVAQLLQMPDGSIYVGGEFIYTPQPRLSLMRLRPAQLPTAVRPRAAANELAVFPNPARDYLTVRWNPGTPPLALSLYNALGQTVQRVRPLPGSGEQQVVLATLPVGVYLLRADYADGPLTRRVVVQ